VSLTEPRKTLGRIDPARIASWDIDRPDTDLLNRLRAISDPTPTISDVFDHLGIVGRVVGASILRPTIDSAVIVGPAVTLRNAPLNDDCSVQDRALSRTVRQAEIEAHNLSKPGDVLVIDGVRDFSNMGGISADMARRQGTIGAIVSGGIRDVEHGRATAFPFWSSDRTPVTGKYRIETLEINGPVKIFGVDVNPGDIVVADSTGVCFIPPEHLRAVVEGCEEVVALEAVRVAGIHAGEDFADVFKGALN